MRVQDWYKTEDWYKADGIWYHVVEVYDHTTRTTTIYADGEKVWEG